MQVHRGFLMVKNKSGGLVPFFIKVRQEDILDASGQEDNKEIIGEDSKWKYVKHSLSTDKRIQLLRRFALDSPSYVTSANCVTTVTLPFKLSMKDSVILIGKETSGSTIFGPSTVEGCLIDGDNNGYSDTLEIRFFSPSSRFTEANILLDTIVVSVNINGYIE